MKRLCLVLIVVIHSDMFVSSWKLFSTNLAKANIVYFNEDDEAADILIKTKTHSNPQQHQSAEEKASLHNLHFRRPIPSNVNLKNEKPICIFFPIEGRGDHNVKRAMPRGRGWVRTTRVASLSCRPIPSHVNLKKERPVCIFFTLEGHGGHNVIRIMRRRRGWVRKLIRLRTLFGVVSLFGGSTTGVSMSSCCYTEAPADYSTEAVKYYFAPIFTTTTEAAKYYAVPTYNREAALSCHVEQKYYTDAPVRYTTTYAKPQPPSTTPKKPPITQQPTYCADTPNYFSVPSCYTEAPADNYTKTVEYYTEAAKYFSTLSYSTRTEAANYYAVLTYNPEAALSYYVEQKYYTDAPIYYTTTYATPSYNTAVAKYYTEEAACYSERGYVRCLVYYIEEFKYYPAPNYYHLKFICITPAILLTVTTTHVAPTYTSKF
ncbi:hypothetical protein DAPPUDRAFT_98195 [Daphnia pulex]|uniref:Uncharacterized protein n=1 Tax=Daphnia pulex TaxID=6669 RepID=E9G2L3_DAPPU|nr:hypothetical protein DAPPUDRAFT_98195 [Daphnia pulex]|eukprot:EFX86279.1 hypothetical protein DAPPUDRAFT_98195 [Daphnia pulex]